MRKRGNGGRTVTTVLIADDYPFFRRGLRIFIEEQSDLMIVGEADGAADLPALCDRLGPDIILVAPGIGDADGVALIRALAERQPRAGIIAMLTPDEEGILAACIESGAAGCIMKNADPPLILSAIRAVSAGEQWLQREMTAKLFDELRRARVAERERAAAPLSDRETEILKLLAEGLRNAQIAERLFISERTVKVHVANIFGKLGLHDRVQATRHAIRSGLVRL
jgi:DNA-binding NarL/FixJ family response regulator